MKLEVFLMSKRKELVKELIKEFDLKDTNDISSMFRELMGDTIQEMLNGEMDETLGYDKYDQSEKNTDNSRNGFSQKNVEVNMVISRSRFLEIVTVNLNRRSSKNIKKT